jgi:hypothetical protein
MRVDAGEAQAEDELREHLGRMRGRLGRNHPGVVTAYGQYALHLSASGKVKESRRELSQVLTTMETAIGGERPEMFQQLVAHHIAVAAGSRRRARRAERLLRRDIDRYTAVLGADHLHILTARVVLGGILFARGRLVDAELQLRYVLTTLDRRCGETLDMLVIRRELARLSAAQGHVEKGVRELRTVRRKQLQLLGREHAETRRSQELLSDLELREVLESGDRP